MKLEVNSNEENLRRLAKAQKKNGKVILEVRKIH